MDIKTTNLINFGTCATAAGTSAKVVTLEGFGLINYAKISVYFSTANTVTAATTLNRREAFDVQECY
ncbi:MAG: hypothetical protein LBM98_13655 [Oscillospiraceae bacterium]|nr:hypothetical protein [Oscillospiraceae bacterium]